MLTWHCTHTQIGRLQGGAQFLQGLGFQSAPLEGSLSHEVARSPEAHTALVLAQHREDSALLSAARTLLCTEAVGLGVSPGDLPPAVRSVRAGAAAVPAAPFDPYKSMVVSCTCDLVLLKVIMHTVYYAASCRMHTHSSITLTNVSVLCTSVVIVLQCGHYISLIAQWCVKSCCCGADAVLSCASSAVLIQLRVRQYTVVALY
jgi:hypothetical protein